MERGPLRKNMVAVAGPTGCGKSELALRLAGEFDGEIVNCDSVQIYRFFNIGTAKLPEEVRRGIPHHLIDVADPDEVFTAGDFARVGRAILHETAARGHLPVVTGGTGFYLRALLDGLAPGPQRDEVLRARLRQREAERPGSLHRLLRASSTLRLLPGFIRMTLRKVMRARDVPDFRARSGNRRFFCRRGAMRCRVSAWLKIGLFPNREQLYKRLDSRMETMFSAGLIEETESILALGYAASCKPFESIGYRKGAADYSGRAFTAGRAVLCGAAKLGATQNAR